MEVDISDVKKYIDHCVREHLALSQPSPLSTGTQEVNMTTDGVRDDVNIHNIFKGLGGHDGGGFGGFGGGGLLGGLLIGALLGRNGGGLFGNNGNGDGGGVNQITSNMLLQKLGDIQAAIPLASAQTENIVLQQTNALTAQNGQLALGTQQGFSATKDAVQAGTVINLQATQNASKEILQAICQLSGKIDQGTISQLQAEVAEANSRHRALEGNLTITQQVNQQQQQQQQQQLLDARFNQLFGLVANQTMLARQAQDIVNLGTMTASGTQAAANTQVR